MLDQQWTSYCAYEYQQKSASSGQSWTFPYGGPPQGNLDALQATILLGLDSAGMKGHYCDSWTWNHICIALLSPPPWGSKECPIWIPDDNGDIRPEEEEALLRDLESVTSRISFEQYKGNAFFFTSTGHMGMGTPMMKAGDIVCLLLGARVPFILRPYKALVGHASDERHYDLIGDCCMLSVRSWDWRITFCLLINRLAWSYGRRTTRLACSR